MRSETLALLGELVGFNTVSSRSNRELIDHVARTLRAHTIETHILPSADGTKANLWASIGPAVDGGVVLSGHSDVVPVDGQAWHSDPFSMMVREGCAFGRGVADMKGFIACAITALARHRHTSLRVPIHLALTYDEEVGCLGTPHLLEWLGRQLIRPRLALIGEPTGMRVVHAHKGILLARTEIQGVESHSSLAHQGVSAVALAARAIVLLQELEAGLSENFRDGRFEPAITTCSPNRMGGGTAINILAGHAWFDWDVRSLPGLSGAEVLERFRERLQAQVLEPIRSRYPQVAARTTTLADIPALAPEREGPAEALATQLLDQGAALAVSFGTEGGQFQHAGYSTVVVGPGSMEQAHKADEFVSLEQLARCERFLDDLAKSLTA